MKDPFSRCDRLVLNDLCHQVREGNWQIVGTIVPQRDRQAGLRIRVHQKDLLTGHREPDAKILTGGGLARAAFLVSYCRNHGLIRQ